MAVNNIFSSYEIYADVFSYPEKSLRNKVENIMQHLENFYPAAANEFKRFSEFAIAADIKSWEEIYTRSFDVQALTTLDLGYVLFGDDYKRGELLVNLSNEHKKANNPCGNELGDHLPNLLRLLGKLDSEELRNDLITHIIKPALAKIFAEFDIRHIEKKSMVYKKHHRTIIENDETYGLIYQSTIHALILMLEQDFSGSGFNIPHDKNFTRQVSSELEIEKLG